MILLANSRSAAFGFWLPQLDFIQSRGIANRVS